MSFIVAANIIVVLRLSKNVGPEQIGQQRGLRSASNKATNSNNHNNNTTMFMIMLSRRRHCDDSIDPVYLMNADSTN